MSASSNVAPPESRSPSASSARSIEPTRAPRRRSSSYMGSGPLPSSWDNCRSIRRERLRGADALLAGRSGICRGGSCQPRGLREEDPEAGCRPHCRGDRPARREAGRDGPFHGRPAHVHDRRDRGCRPPRWRSTGAISRCSAAAVLGVEVGQPGAAGTGSTEAGRSPSRSTSSSTDGPTRSTTRRRGSCTTSTTSPGPGWPWRRWRTRM